MQSRALLLGICLCAAAALAAAQDDSNFCASVAPENPGSAWEWVSDMDEAGGMVFPEEVLNATVAYFDEMYVPGMGLEADKRDIRDQWVPCTEEDRSLTAMGCVTGTESGGEVYNVRLMILCDHIDHNDTAIVTALVTLPANGTEGVELTDVELDVDESHTELPKCTTAFCTDCNRVVAVEGEVPDKEICKTCVDGYAPDSAGVCQRLNSTASRKLLYTPDDKSCPVGEYLYKGTIQGGCGACTRPGCVEGEMSKTEGVPTDCVWCYTTTQGNCPRVGPGANQWCRSCTYGYFWQDQGCNQCEDYVANCADCQPCSDGKACHGGTVCVQCEVGYTFRGDGYGYCVPE
ncbi:hypothetical protein CHLNCDRAFT_133975 [Chlorella variabilis]|uniref:TNFR-Cys domain-containing protein n=1 Tax=Chlorella variabilis TaxID=554065 RepID=E1ZEP8_CHLVA|nr:hypothetical protein CHLNCDRAFT_133975 [Chlorella variabilis]EFN55535.1 hypothetical protein CHLNCDRAFT_133975 [Chlorella variabilis]|eukprot:XP_005847637.1 hypothetical protein CHLNCDRAFT_133975 [Chlorella variabilis]